MAELLNLVVDLDERFDAIAPPPALPGFSFEAQARADERTLAWIDEAFGGTWSGEAHAGSNALAWCDGAPIGFATYDPKGLRFRWLRGLGRERGVGIFGPFGVAEAQRRSGVGRWLLHAALAGLRRCGYSRALIPAVGSEELVRYYGRAVGAEVVERFDRDALAAPRPRTLVMASGSGTNLQAVLDGAASRKLPIDVVALVSNSERAFAIERARRAGVDAIAVLPWARKEEARASYDERLLRAVEAHHPDLILLLGWMHLLSEPFVRAFPNLLNVHPAYLPLDPARDEVGVPDGTFIPAFRGPHAVADALAAGSAWTGATVHFVTPHTDRGPVMTRKPLSVSPGEEEAHVMERLHPIEHRLVSQAILRWLYERET